MLHILFRNFPKYVSCITPFLFPFKASEITLFRSCIDTNHEEGEYISWTFLELNGEMKGLKAKGFHPFFCEYSAWHMPMGLVKFVLLLWLFFSSWAGFHSWLQTWAALLICRRGSWRGSFRSHAWIQLQGRCLRPC